MKEISTKHANFRRLAETRTTGVLEAIRKLSILSSPNYEYDDAEVEKIFDAIEDALKQARASFAPSAKTKARFKLTE